MLDAFNIKNVRRVLAPRSHEHLNQANEDAITSMVFTPLRFMTAKAAFECLGLMLPGLDDCRRGRNLKDHKVEFWKTGLQAQGWAGIPHTRVEPDLLVRFWFDGGAPLTVIGEMKWDWDIALDALETEVRRQRDAVAGAQRDDTLFSFVLLRQLRPTRNTSPWNCAIDWFSVHRDLSRALRSGEFASGPVWEWLSSVSAFLIRAERATFSGMSGQYGPTPELSVPMFFSATK